MSTTPHNQDAPPRNPVEVTMLIVTSAGVPHPLHLIRSHISVDPSGVMTISIQTELPTPPMETLLNLVNLPRPFSLHSEYKDSVTKSTLLVETLPMNDSVQISYSRDSQPVSESAVFKLLVR